MSGLSGEDLQTLALGRWKANRPLYTSLWQQLVAHGLYQWAVDQQSVAFQGQPAPPVPSLEALQAAERPALQLTPPPATPVPAVSLPKRLSTRMLNRNRQAMAAVVARQKKEQAVAFAPRDFVMFSLPHKRLADVTAYERRNGHYRFRLETGGNHSVPFGQDRLVPLWIATAFKAAGQPADNRIRFRSASDILAAFRIPVEGGATKLLTERFERWFHTTLYVYDESVPERRRFRSYRMLNGGQLWYQRGGNTNQFTLWQNVLELDGQFADDLRRSTIPIDFETIIALREMPGALDLYLWQAHRSWELARQGATRPVVIPLSLLRAQLGSQSPGRKGKQLIKKWQSVIKEIWPHCPNFFDATQDLFFLHGGKAVFERTTTKLPGVMPEPPVPLRGPEGPLRPEEGLFLQRPKEP